MAPRLRLSSNGSPFRNEITLGVGQFLGVRPVRDPCGVRRLLQRRSCPSRACWLAADFAAATYPRSNRFKAGLGGLHHIYYRAAKVRSNASSQVLSGRDMSRLSRGRSRCMYRTSTVSLIRALTVGWSFREGQLHRFDVYGKHVPISALIGSPANCQFAAGIQVNCPELRSVMAPR